MSRVLFSVMFLLASIQSRGLPGQAISPLTGFKGLLVRRAARYCTCTFRFSTGAPLININKATFYIRLSLLIFSFFPNPGRHGTRDCYIRPKRAKFDRGMEGTRTWCRDRRR